MVVGQMRIVGIYQTISVHKTYFIVFIRFLLVPNTNITNTETQYKSYGRMNAIAEKTIYGKVIKLCSFCTNF